jgi:hypothetical protein
MARLALLVALVALVFSWAAYRRSGGQLQEIWSDATRGAADFRVGNPVDDGTAALGRQTDLAKAQARLLGHRAEVAGDRNLGAVERDVAEVRRSLERSYRNASATTREKWQGVDAELNRLESQLRQGGASALATFDSAVAKIRSMAGEEKKDER